MAARGSHQRGPGIAAKSSGRLAPGQAPPIGLKNERLARENLEAKLSLIHAWVEKIQAPDGAGSIEPLVPLSKIPRSQRAFNKWESIGLPEAAVRQYGSFHRNGNPTLVKNDTLLKKLLAYFRILDLAEEAKPARLKSETVASLRRRLAMEKLLRGIAEKELARSRAQVWKSREEQETLRAEVASTEAYAADLIAKLEAMLQKATAERAELARALSNVVGIREASSD